MRNRLSSVYEEIRQQVGDELFDAYTKNMNKGEKNEYSNNEKC